MRGRVLGVIPARLASTRLPRKPLHPLLGRPLVEWVWRRAAAMPVLDALVVATDHDEVAEVCRGFGAAVELTDPRHPSGTDRVAEVACREAWRGYEVVVNLQGDEPLMAPEHVVRATELVTEGGWQVGTCAAPIGTEEARLDPSVVKVARARDGRGLYFSRAPIPFQRDGTPDAEALAAAPFLRHLGIYVYRREALLEWVSLPPSPLEELERLEQLRPLEAGIRLGVAVVAEAAPGVDTPADALRMEALLKESGEVDRPDQAITPL